MSSRRSILKVTAQEIQMQTTRKSGRAQPGRNGLTLMISPLLSDGLEKNIANPAPGHYEAL